jgi:hypothetical protein
MQSLYRLEKRYINEKRSYIADLRKPLHVYVLTCILITHYYF